MKKIIAYAIALLALVSCAKEVALSIPECQKTYEFEAEGSTQFLTVSNTDFSVSCDADWIFTQIYRGNSVHNLRVTASKNTKAVDRTARIILTPEDSSAPVEISIFQKGTAPFIKILSTSVSLGMEDEKFTLAVISNTAFDVQTPDWIRFDGESQESADSCGLHFSTTGKVKLGETRDGRITLTSKGASSTVTAEAFVEQVGARWETVVMKWGLEDIQYIWESFGKSTAAITTATIAAADFSSFPRMKVYGKGGFVYTNENGDELYTVMSSDAQFKINKAGAKTSTGNINRDGENVERMQMSKAMSGIGENSFMFIAPRSGILEIEAAAPNSGDRKTQILVDGVLIEENFAAPYAIPSGITEIPITVTAPEGAEVRFYGTAGAINYFQIKYTYERPVLE